MVLFAKSLSTKAYLLAHRTISTSNPNRFIEAIRDVPVPFKRGAAAGSHAGSAVTLFEILISTVNVRSRTLYFYPKRMKHGLWDSFKQETK